MRNPKEFKATPFNHFKPVDKSHTGTHELSHNGTRKEILTPDSHSGKVEKSGYDGMGAPYSKASDREEKLTPNSHFKPTPHSMPDVPKEPRKWHKKYSLDSKLGG